MSRHEGHPPLQKKCTPLHIIIGTRCTSQYNNNFERNNKYRLKIDTRTADSRGQDSLIIIMRYLSDVLKCFSPGIIDTVYYEKQKKKKIPTNDSRETFEKVFKRTVRRSGSRQRTHTEIYIIMIF